MKTSIDTAEKSLKLSELRTIWNIAKEHSIDFREIVEAILEDQPDFIIDDFRFIKESEIDRIQCEELESDPYILGCFESWFIADHTELSFDIVEALREAGKFEAIGQHIIDNDYVKEIQSAYARIDGYGHHFAGYDSETREELLDLGYYFFKN